MYFLFLFEIFSCRGKKNQKETKEEVKTKLTTYAIKQISFRCVVIQQKLLLVGVVVSKEGKQIWVLHISNHSQLLFEFLTSQWFQIPQPLHHNAWSTTYLSLITIPENPFAQLVATPGILSRVFLFYFEKILGNFGQFWVFWEIPANIQDLASMKFVLKKNKL